MRTPTFASAATAALLVLAIAAPTAPARAQVSITMEVQQEKKGKRIEKNDVTTTMMGDGQRGAVITEMPDGTGVTMVVDPQARHTTTVMTDKNGERSAVRMPNIKLPKGSQPDMVFDGEFEATGETKTILGYEAEKYLVTQEGNTSEMWIANVPGYDYNLIAEGLGHGDAGAGAPDIGGVEYPVALESHTTSKNGKEATHLYVRDIAVGADVDMSLMEVPAGVELNDMSALLKGFGG